MTTAAHTPGPWAYEPTSGAIYFADGDVEPVIADINQDSVSIEQADADGILMAAAPDLFAALCELGSIISDALEDDEVDAMSAAGGYLCGDVMKDALHAALAAITKARGSV